MRSVSSVLSSLSESGGATLFLCFFVNCAIGKLSSSESGGLQTNGKTQQPRGTYISYVNAQTGHLHPNSTNRRVHLPSLGVERTRDTSWMFSIPFDFACEADRESWSRRANRYHTTYLVGSTLRALYPTEAAMLQALLQGSQFSYITAGSSPDERHT